MSLPKTTQINSYISTKIWTSEKVINLFWSDWVTFMSFVTKYAIFCNVLKQLLINTTIATKIPTMKLQLHLSSLLLMKVRKISLLLLSFLYGQWDRYGINIT